MKHNVVLPIASLLSAGGFFFVWTLWALGGLGGFTFVLSVRGLWNLRRGQ